MSFRYNWVLIILFIQIAFWIFLYFKKQNQIPILRNAKPEVKTKKLSFVGIKIPAFRNNNCHLKNNTNHPDVTNKSMIGINSILKSEILS